MDVQNILPIWQPQGYSTHIIAKKVSEKFGVKTSHTGTLDPMAEGVIIVLLGKERLKKYEYAKWHKGYVFEIAFGIETDTYDGMGIPRLRAGTALSQVDPTSIENSLKSMKGYYRQKVPIYSAVKVKGKPLYHYARSKKKVKLPEVDGTLVEIKLLDFYGKKVDDLISETIRKISRVSGDFRQKEIVKGWERLRAGTALSRTTAIARIYTETTKGIYIRSLSQDICDRLRVVGHVSSLVRIKNGEYEKENSKDLVDVFGKNYLQRYDFESKTHWS